MLMTIVAHLLFAGALVISGRLAGESLNRLAARAGHARPRFAIRHREGMSDGECAAPLPGCAALHFHAP